MKGSNFMLVLSKKAIKALGAWVPPTRRLPLASNELGLHSGYMRLRAKVLLHSGETPQCTANAHHWMLESPVPGEQGKLPLGQCKSCLRVRRFKNTYTVTAWTSKPKTEAAVKASQAAKVAALSG